MKINERFETVKSNILMMEKVPSILKSTEFLQQEETHKIDK